MHHKDQISPLLKTIQKQRLNALPSHFGGPTTGPSSDSLWFLNRAVVQLNDTQSYKGHTYKIFFKDCQKCFLKIIHT